jgi:hypothetical protein
LAARSPPRTANPSIAELSWGGTSIGETMSRASTRASASRTGTSSTSPTGRMNPSMIDCALATGSAFGS